MVPANALRTPNSVATCLFVVSVNVAFFAVTARSVPQAFGGNPIEINEICHFGVSGAILFVIIMISSWMLRL